MKKLFSLVFLGLFAAFLIGCGGGGGDKPAGPFKSSDCQENKNYCIAECKKKGGKLADCANTCEQSRGMCQAMKVKGCLQECNMKFGKGSLPANQCQDRCRAQ